MYFLLNMPGALVAACARFVMAETALAVFNHLVEPN